MPPEKEQAMVDRWDDIQILQAIDRIQQERFDGGPMRVGHGLWLMEEINGGPVFEHQRWRGFVQELHIARDRRLVTFKVQHSPRPNLAEADPYYYLQTVSDFALTVEGQDRARGRVVVQPLPDPAGDDGRQLSNLIFKQIAAAITDEYAPDEVADFLAAEGIPPEELPLSEDMAEGDAYTILTALWRWGSPGRRMTRQFIGRWLADRLPTGPDPELRARLVEQLARQGWFVRDAVLVVGDPIQGVPVSAPFLRATRLHPLIEAEARPQFLISKPDQGVFASLKAVEIRVRKLGGLGNQLVGVDLMNRAFGPTGPLTDPGAAVSPGARS